jgi:hypothetical protein
MDLKKRCLGVFQMQHFCCTFSLSFFSTYFLICKGDFTYIKFSVILNTCHYSNKYFYLMLYVICLQFFVCISPNDELRYFNVNRVCCFVLRIFVIKVKKFKDAISNFKIVLKLYFVNLSIKNVCRKLAFICCMAF